MELDRIKTLVLVSLIFMLPLSLCFGGDERSMPAEVYIIFDNSVSMKDSKDEAVAWINEHVLDQILQSGDSLTIWSVADKPVLEFSGTISSPEKIGEVKKILSSITPKDITGNYRSAFEELQRKTIPNPRYTLSYTILITGLSEKTTSLSGAEAVNILKYSRSKDFPGWKVMIIGLGLEQRVKTAAAAYMSSRQ